MFFQFSSALAQEAGSKWGKGCANGSSSAAPGLPAPPHHRDVTHWVPWVGDMVRVLGLGVSVEVDAEGGGEGMLRWLLALQVLRKALEGRGLCVDTATAAEIEP